MNTRQKLNFDNIPDDPVQRPPAAIVKQTTEIATNLGFTSRDNSAVGSGRRVRPTKGRTKQFTIRLNPDTVDKINECATLLNAPALADVIEQAIEDYYQKVRG